MQIPLQITLHGISPSEALQSAIRERAAKLELFESRITRCRVTVDESGQHQRKGHRFNVRIEVRAPDHKDIVASRHSDEDVYIALRDAFDAATRRLQESGEFVSRPQAVPAANRVGTISRIDKDERCGFLVTADGRQLYFREEDVVRPPFDELDAGLEVRFIEEIDADGVRVRGIGAVKHPVY